MAFDEEVTHGWIPYELWEAINTGRYIIGVSMVYFQSWTRNTQNTMTYIINISKDKRYSQTWPIE